MKSIEVIVCERYLSQQELQVKNQIEASNYIDWAQIGAAEAQKWFPISELTYEETGGLKFIGKNKYGCVSTARISNSGITSDDESILPFVEWRPLERRL